MMLLIDFQAITNYQSNELICPLQQKQKTLQVLNHVSCQYLLLNHLEVKPEYGMKYKYSMMYFILFKQFLCFSNTINLHFSLNISFNT